MRSTLTPMYVWIQNEFKEKLYGNRAPMTPKQFQLLKSYMENQWLMELMARSFFEEWWAAKYDDVTPYFSVEEWTREAMDRILKYQSEKERIT